MAVQKVMGGKKVYVVFIGRNPGLYGTWEDCHAQVHGFPGNLYRGFTDLAEAREAFEEYCSRRSKADKGVKVAGRDSSSATEADGNDKAGCKESQATTSHGDTWSEKGEQTAVSVDEVFAMGYLLGALATSVYESEGRKGSNRRS